VQFRADRIVRQRGHRAGQGSTFGFGRRGLSTAIGPVYPFQVQLYLYWVRLTTSLTSLDWIEQAALSLVRVSDCDGRPSESAPSPHFNHFELDLPPVSQWVADRTRTRGSSSGFLHTAIFCGVRRDTRSTVVVTAVNFLSDDGEVGLWGVQRIGLPGKPDRRHLDLCLELTRGSSANEPEVLGWVLISHRLARWFPDHFERHSCGSGYWIQRRPAWLIDNGDVLHFQCEGVAIRTNRQTTLRNGNDPIESRRRNGGVKIVYLIGGDRRSPEQR